MDFAKAFDSIDHGILADKLDWLNLPFNLKITILNYLKNRQHFVAIGQFLSQGFSPTSGVPHGSTLGSPLFSIFINDLKRVVKSRILIFADDVKIFKEIRSFDDAKMIQRDLDNVFKWSEKNKLKLNISKCSVITFNRSISELVFDYTLNKNSLKRVSSISDLGVIFDSKWKFNEQFNNVISSASRCFTFVVFFYCKISNPLCSFYLETSV